MALLRTHAQRNSDHSIVGATGAYQRRCLQCHTHEARRHIGQFSDNRVTANIDWREQAGNAKFAATEEIGGHVDKRNIDDHPSLRSRRHGDVPCEFGRGTPLEGRSTFRTLDPVPFVTRGAGRAKAKVDDGRAQALRYAAQGARFWSMQNMRPSGSRAAKDET